VKPRRWSWTQFWLALALLPVGAACSFLGLAIGLGVGSSTSTHDDWAYPIAETAFLAGPWIAGAGILWLLILIIAGPLRRFSLRTLLIAIAILALILTIFAKAN